MVWIILATLMAILVVRFWVLASGSRQTIHRLNRRLNINVVPVESMVDQMGKIQGEALLQYLHRPDEPHLQSTAQMLLIWQVATVDDSKQNLLQWHRWPQKARLATSITDAQMRLAFGFLHEMESGIQEPNALRMCYNTSFQSEDGVYWLH